MATHTAATTPAAPLKNTRWERFVQNLLEGMPQGRAYEAAGYKARGNAAEVKAAQLVRKVQVMARLEHLKRQAATRAIVNAEDVLRRLADIANARLTVEKATKHGVLELPPDFGEQVRALDLLAKHLGIYAPDRVHVTVGKPLEDLSDDELEEALAHAAASRHPR